ncbi:hypothetical protein YC2023_083806 [Brassica napus]
MQPPFLPHHKSEAKLCRELPEAENPSRRALFPSILRRISLFFLSRALIGHGIARMIDEWIMMHKNPHTDKRDSMN